MTHKITIYEARTTRDISSKLASLEKAYQTTFKRKLPADMLLIGVMGTAHKPIYQITASFKSDQRAIIEFLQEQIGPQ